MVITEWNMHEDDEAERFVAAVFRDLEYYDGTALCRRWSSPRAAGESIISLDSPQALELALPDLADPASLAAYATELQAYAAQFQVGRRPACPEHGYRHALMCEPVDDGVQWTCRRGQWRCPVGQYDEFDWPPADLDDEDVHSRVWRRLFRREITQLRTGHSELRGGRRVVLIGVWPPSAELTAELQKIAAPVPIEVYAQPMQFRG